MTNLIDLKIKAYYKYIKIVKKATESILQDIEMDEDAVYMIKLAVAEAAANIIDHTYEKETDEGIDFTIQKEKNSLVFILRDYGKHVDLAKIKGRNLEDYKEGGLGVYIIKSVMDDVRYESMDKGTKLTMIKKIGDDSFE